jgi:phosphonate transport system substrate-binding protein
MFRIICSIFLLWLLNLPAVSQSLTIATYQYADNDRIANITPIAKFLEQRLKVKVQVKSYKSVHLFIEAIQNGEVDIALINTFGYLLLEASSKPYPMLPLITYEVEEGSTDNYKTSLIASLNSPVNSLEDIISHYLSSRLILVSEGSTSGNLVPRLLLSKLGLINVEKQFQSFSYGLNHKKTLEAVVEDKADLAAMGSAEYLKFISDSSNKDKVKLIWESSEIPLGPYLIKKTLDKKMIDKIAKAFLVVDRKDPKAFEAVKDGWTEAKNAVKLIRIDGSYYDDFKTQFGDLKNLEIILKQFTN